MYRSEAGSIDDVALSEYPVYKSCKDGDVQLLSSFLNAESMISVIEDPIQHWTPIHWAARFGHLDCVRQVASVNPSVINIQSSKTFQTPLHSAAEGGHPHCLLWLIQAGTNPEVKDINGETALHKAARVGSAECVSLLASLSSNVSAQNLNGQTATVLAELGGYPAIAAFIRRHELSAMNEFQSRRSLTSTLCSVPRRKRMRDAICEETFCKRMRTDDISEDMHNLFDVPNVMDSMNSSLVEHNSMYWMEMGYRNTLLDALIGEYEGH